MKYLNTIIIKVLIAVAVGFLLAGAGTKITYTCPPQNNEAGCVSFEKAIMHPNDLRNNKQNSLVKFSTTFAITAGVTFALLSALHLMQKKQ